jgi:putative DNA-invertase from lambdoid prophage Rac
VGKVYGYGRVSTTEQGTSIAAVQPAQIEGYAAALGPRLSRLYTDEGVSGAVPLAERPAGAALLSVLQKGDAVIATKLDRMFRSAHDAISTLEALKKRGVSLHLIDLGGDVTGNGIARLLFTILSGVAEMERERIGERIRDAKAAQRRAGRHLGGRRPFGFDIDDDGQLTPNAAEQATVRDILALRQEGKSLRAIAAAVKARGVTASHESIRQVLKRESASCA